ncbi:MAG: class I SAM-dependent methyltransferase, partial [Candidatus Gracilibacteria bacterium]
MSFRGGKKSNVHDSENGYNLYAPYYDKTLNFLDTFEQDELLKMLMKTRGKKVLDAGCGTGRLVPILSKLGRNVTGIDISAKMIDIAKKKFPKQKFAVGNIEKMTFKDSSFNIVIASFVIVHLKMLPKFFAEVHRILKDGGVFILTNINQRKAPKLKIGQKDEVVIKSFYHMPKEVIKHLN